jgi:hypothetical protein
MTTLFSPQASRARMRNQPWTTCVICRHRSKGPRETVLVIAVVNLTALFGGELLPDFEPRARLHARLSSSIEPRFFFTARPTLLILFISLFSLLAASHSSSCIKRDLPYAFVPSLTRPRTRFTLLSSFVFPLQHALVDHTMPYL